MVDSTDSRANQGEITRRITVERNRLRFAAAHMATFGGGCEPLHGHNYDVLLELEGELTEDAWVWDFGHVKKAARAICEELDHHFLLQRTSTLLGMRESGDSWEISFGQRRYVFPKDNVYELPVPNTSWPADAPRSAAQDAVTRRMCRIPPTRLYRV